MEQIEILRQNYLTILKTEGLEKLEDEIETIDDRLKLLSNRRNRLLNSEDGRGTDLFKNTEKEISELSEKVSIAEDIAQSQYGSHLTRQQRKLTGRKFVQTEMPDGKLYWIDDYDNSDKFANDPIDCYKYRDSDLTKGPKTQQHEKEVAAESSLPSKLDDDWDKHNDEEEKIYGPEFVDVKLYINELFKLQLAGVDKTYKCTDFVKSDKPLKEVSVESEMERAIKRRGELFREGNHRKFLAENNITEEELQALPKPEKIIVNNDKRPQAECGCGDEIAEYFIIKNGVRLRVCSECKKSGNHFDFVCDGCKIPQMNKKFAYLNKDNQPVCSKGCLCK